MMTVLKEVLSSQSHSSAPPRSATRLKEFIIAASHGATQGAFWCCGAEHTEFGVCATPSYSSMPSNGVSAGRLRLALVWLQLMQLPSACPSQTSAPKVGPAGQEDGGQNSRVLEKDAVFAFDRHAPLEQ
eukprot:1161566-Pelagomonas_calceolata.AAC.10